MDVLSFIVNPAVRDIGAVAIVTLVVLMLLTGRLIPRLTHEREIAAANKRGDEWKETALKGRELIEQQSAQLTKFADASKTPAEFFGTVMRAGGESHAQADAPHT